MSYKSKMDWLCPAITKNGGGVGLVDIQVDIQAMLNAQLS